MMSFLIRPQRVCLSLFLSLASAAGFAQQSAAPAGQAPSQEPALTPRPSAVPAPNAAEGRIHLGVVVNDKSGKPISGLELNDFTLLDNGSPSKILSFHAVDTPTEEPKEPVQAILVLDSANLSFSTVSQEREEIDRFLRSNGGKLLIPTSVFMVSDIGVKLLAQPSLDGNSVATQLDQASSGLRSITRASGGNGAIERLELSIQSLDSLVRIETGKPGRKLLVWIGDGWPLLNGPSFSMSSKAEQQLFGEVVRMSTSLREARINVYSVTEGFFGPRTNLYQDFVKGVKLSRQVNPGNLSVKVFAVQSGGRVLSPSNDLAGEFAKCVEDAAPYYTISFDPPHPDKPDEYHDLKVQIAKPGLTARTSTGYYDQP
jgi:VWFA-related protein